MKPVSECSDLQSEDSLRCPIQVTREEDVEDERGSGDGPTYKHRVPSLDDKRFVVEVAETQNEVRGDKVTGRAHGQDADG